MAAVTGTACTRCGVASPSSARFCKRCGGPLAAHSEQPPDAAPALLTCDACGRASGSGSKFCKFCGAAVKPAGIAVQAPPVAATPVIPAAAVVTPGPAFVPLPRAVQGVAKPTPEPTASTSSGSLRRGLYLALTAGLLIALGAGAWYLWLRPQRASEAAIGTSETPRAEGPPSATESPRRFSESEAPGQVIAAAPEFIAKLEVSSDTAVFSLITASLASARIEIDRNADGIINPPPQIGGGGGHGMDVLYGTTSSGDPCVSYLIDEASTAPCGAFTTAAGIKSRRSDSSTVLTVTIPVSELTSVHPRPLVAFRVYNEETNAWTRLPKSGFMTIPDVAWGALAASQARDASGVEARPVPAPSPDVSSILARAQSLFESRRYSAALAEAERAAELDPQNDNAKRLVTRIKDTMDILGVRR